MSADRSRHVAGPRALSGRAPRAATEFLIAAIAGIAIAGVFLRISPIAFVGAIVGVAFLWFCVGHPEFAVLAIVLFTATIFNVDDILLVPVPGVGSLNLADLLLMFLLGLTVFRLAQDERYRARLDGLSIPLAWFIVAAMVSVYVAIALRGGARSDAVRLFRHLAYYLLFVPVSVLLVTRESTDRLILGLAVLACLVAGAMMLQAALGQSVSLMPGRLESARTAGTSFNATRIVPPGLTLIFAMVTTVLALALSGERRRLLLLGPASLLLLAGIGLTFFRTYWMVVIGAVGLFWLASRPKERMRGALRGVLLLCALAVVVWVLVRNVPAIGTFLEALWYRLRSALAIQRAMSQQETLGERAIESMFAVRRIREVPLLGVGLGNEFRYQFDEWDVLMAYLHNGYLYATVSMGLFGSVPLVLFYLGAIRRGFSRSAQIADAYQRRVVLAVSSWLVGAMLASIIHPILMEWISIVVIATLVGLNNAIWFNDRASR